MSHKNELAHLLGRWQKLEPYRCKGPCVRLHGGFRSVYACGEDRPEGKWDDFIISAAVQIACEARGWVLVVEDYPGREGPRCTYAVVRIPADGWGPCQPADKENRTTAILSAYVQMLEHITEDSAAEE